MDRILRDTVKASTLAQIELWANSAIYENKVYILSKHLDEKVAFLSLNADGREVREVRERAG